MDYIKAETVQSEVFTFLPWIQVYAAPFMFLGSTFKRALKLPSRWWLGVLQSRHLQQDCWKRQWTNYLNNKPLFTQVLLISAHSQMIIWVSAGGSCGASHAVGLVCTLKAWSSSFFCGPQRTVCYASAWGSRTRSSKGMYLSVLSKMGDEVMLTRSTLAIDNWASLH